MFKRIANKMLDNVESVVIREASRALTPHIQKAVDSAVDSMVTAAKNSKPSVRSTGGGTSIYLTKVTRDFKDFHAEDADTAIQTFIIELIGITYGQIDAFDKANVSSKVAFNINKQSGVVSDILFNAMSIAGYQKSLNVATLNYRASVGYNINGKRVEKLYQIEYTLQLRDDYGEKSFLECGNCGAPLTESSGECKYCGMKHLRDTTENWVITDYKII